MDLIQSILMGIVQGLSEFLPISSSAHLVFTSNFYKVFKGIEIVQETNQEVFLDIMLHLGTVKYDLEGKAGSRTHSLSL